MGYGMVETPYGLQSCVWTFVSTVSRCLTFPVLPEVTRSHGQVYDPTMERLPFMEPVSGSP